MKQFVGYICIAIMLPGMKQFFLTVFCLLVSLVCFCQDWSDDQLEKAGTAANIQSLTDAEKAIILYVNLARMYPKDFAVIELSDDYYLNTESKSFTNSLREELNNAVPLAPLEFDAALYESARCFAKESGDRGTVGHKRKGCRFERYAECCSYGVKEGWDVALQWLIDADVAGVGHRRNWLNPAFTKMAVSMQPHKKYRVCAVAEMK